MCRLDLGSGPNLACKAGAMEGLIQRCCGGIARPSPNPAVQEGGVWSGAAQGEQRGVAQPQSSRAGFRNLAAREGWND